MEMNIKTKTTALWIILFFFISGCYRVEVGTDPYNDSFFEKEKLLMSKTELDIYNHLPDRESKIEFIGDFWKRRDPSPFTEENELKDRFDQRVAHAQKWFYEKGEKDSGWNTDRGRVYIMFGQPDRQETTEVQRSRSGQMVSMIIWSYDRYQMNLRFIDEMGLNVYYLTHDSQFMILNAREKQLRSWGLEDLSKEDFYFRGKYRNGALRIRIPLKNLQVAADEENIVATFQVDIVIYHKYKKLDALKIMKDLSYPKEEAVNKKSISFDIPYSLKEKGHYYFDVIVKNTVSSRQFRDFIKVKR